MYNPKHHRPTPMTVAEKLSAGGLISLRKDFCGWAGICAVSAYREVREGRLRVTKIGRKTMVAATDALAWRDRMRGVA
jgi:hypothetical protein